MSPSRLLSNHSLLLQIQTFFWILARKLLHQILAVLSRSQNHVLLLALKEREQSKIIHLLSYFLNFNFECLLPIIQLYITLRKFSFNRLLIVISTKLQVFRFLQLCFELSFVVFQNSISVLQDILTAGLYKLVLLSLWNYVLFWRLFACFFPHPPPCRSLLKGPCLDSFLHILESFRAVWLMQLYCLISILHVFHRFFLTRLVSLRLISSASFLFYFTVVQS